MFKEKLFIFSALFVLSFMWSFESLAQGIAGINANDVTIRTEPEIPEAGQNVLITLSSYLMNLDNAKIEWKIDGAVQRTGIGEKKFSITTKGVGVKQTVTATIFDLGTGVKLEKNLIIEPSGIDLLWEVENGYVHNFYKGKTLPVKESLIEMTAIPTRKNQTTSAQKNLIYNWKRNFDNIPDASGFSKQSFDFKSDYLKDVEKIEVTARESATNYVSSKKIDLVMYNPILLFYQKKDGLGVDYWNALNNGFVVGVNDFSIIADPFFITPKDKNDANLKYTWKVNNTAVGTPQYKSYLTIRGDGGSGTSAIQLDINNLGRIFQSVSRTLQVSVTGN